MNLVLRQDPNTLDRLANIQGKVIGFYFSDLDTRLYLFPNAEGIQVQYIYEDEADTTLSGSLPAFINMLTGDSAEVLFSGKVVMQGDIQLGQSFKRTLDQLDIDWEEIFSSFTGDIVAHKAGNLFRDFNNWHKQTFENLKLDTREYLQEEGQINPRPEELKQFSNEISELRNKTEILHARLTRLQSSISKPL